MSRERLQELRSRARYEELKAKAGKKSEIPAVDSSDSFGVKALDAVGTQMQMASDAVVAGVDSIPGMGYVKKGMAAVAAPLKGQTYEETADGYNQDIKDRWERNPTHALGGSLLFGSKMPNVAGNGAVSRIAQNTGVAALDALGRDKAGLNTDSVANASKVTAGVGLATELPGLAGKAAKAINPEKIADSLETFANNKAVKALNPILSQQERLDNRGLTQKLGKELLDKKVVKFGSSVDDMLPRVEKLLSDKGDEIGSLRKGADDLGAQVDLRELEHEAIRRLDAAKGMGTDAESYANAFAKEVENITSNPTRNISDTGDLLGELGKAGKYNRVSAPVKADAVRDVRSMVKTLSDEATANVSKPIHDQHNDAREVFSLLKSGEEILDKSTARGAKNASIGLRDTIFGASGMSKDGSMSESSLRAAAIMMASKLIRERGNASAAVLAKKLADFARSSSGKLPGSSFNGAGTTLDKVTSQAKVTLSKMAGDKVYEAITGDEEMPDPIKDKAVQYLTEKYNLSPTEQKVLRRLVPGVYDIAGMVKGRIGSHVRENSISKNDDLPIPKRPKSKLWSTRNVDHNGEVLKHEIYKYDNGALEHVLTDKSNKPIAAISGHNVEAPDDNGFVIDYARSFTKGQGHGKKLYDLLLNTHNNVFSDKEISPGAASVWEDYLAKNSNLDVELAGYGNDIRHKASIKNPEGFTSNLRADKFSKDPSRLPVANRLEIQPQPEAPYRGPTTAEQLNRLKKDAEELIRYGSLEDFGGDVANNPLFDQLPNDLKQVFSPYRSKSK